MNEFALLDTAARGMTAQRAMLDIAARNVAAAQASTPGHPYERLVASLTPQPLADGPDDDEMGADMDAVGGDDAPALDAPLTISQQPGSGDPLTEMIAVLDAQRAYEANASMFDIGKRLAERTLDIDS
jgi:flagellar basal-body rod protein FlgC